MSPSLCTNLEIDDTRFVTQFAPYNFLFLLLCLLFLILILNSSSHKYLHPNCLAIGIRSQTLKNGFRTLMRDISMF